MKRIFAILLSVILLAGLCSCGEAKEVMSEWQKQYDSGTEFLSDGNYEEAIAAFNAAIEIDPKQPEAYLNLAKAYAESGDVEKAREVLESGIDKTGSKTLTDYLAELSGVGDENLDDVENVDKKAEIETIELDNGTFVIEYDSTGKTIKETYYNPNGTISFTYDYDSNGNKIKETHYNPDETISSTYDYDSNGNSMKITEYNPDGTISSYSTSDYDSNENMIKSTYYNFDGTTNYYYTFDYDSNGNMIKKTYYNSDGTISCTYEYYYNPDGTFSYTLDYDSNGNIINSTYYNSDGTVRQ